MITMKKMLAFEHKNRMLILCNEIKRRMFEIVIAGSGHLGGPLSSLQMMVALYFGGILRYDPNDPYNPNRDRVLMRGHLGTLRYPIFSLLNWIEKEELKEFHSLGSRLQGHEDMRKCPGVDLTPSGSLGMVLSFGAGAALALQRVASPAKVYVFLGDGEEQEGMVQEAIRHIPMMGLTNIVCILDKNAKQLSMPVDWTDKADVGAIWHGAGWNVLEIQNAHDLENVVNVLSQARDATAPTLVIAHTIKGLGISGAEEHYSGYHTSSVCPEECLRKALEVLPTYTDEMISAAVGGCLEYTTIPRATDLFTAQRPPVVNVGIMPHEGPKPPKVAQLSMHSTTEAIKQLSTVEYRVYAMTADLIKPFQIVQYGFDADNVLFLNCGLREQHMVGLAHGIANTDPNCKVIVHYGDAFIDRPADMLNAMAQVNTPNVVFLGTNGGLSAALNGFTHQSAGQPAMLQFMAGMKFYEPGDPIDAVSAFNQAINATDGPQYIRYHGLATYNLPTQGNLCTRSWRVLQLPSCGEPAVILIGCGLTVNGVFEAGKDFPQALVVDVLDPTDLRGLAEILPEEVPVLTFYNGTPEILGAWVALALAKHPEKHWGGLHYFGFGVGTSAPLKVVINHFGLDKTGVLNTVHQVLER